MIKKLGVFLPNLKVIKVINMRGLINDKCRWINSYINSMYYILLCFFSFDNSKYKKNSETEKMDESKSDKLKIKELKGDVPKSDESKIKESVSEKESKDIDDIYFYDKKVETWECGYCGCENPMSVDICSACGEGGRD